MSFTRYLNLDSTYRNRVQYPLQSNFTVIASDSGNNLNALTAYDPVSDAYPIYPSPLLPTVAFAAGSTNLLPVLDVGADGTIPNFYIGYYLQDTTTGESRLITEYNLTAPIPTIPPNQVTGLSSPFPAGSAVPGNNFVIRKSLPLNSGLITGSTVNTVTLALTASSADQAYYGQFILFPTTNQVVKVTNYVGATRVATFIPAISPALAIGTFYEILAYTRDNSNRLYNIVTTRDMNCYEIELISLIMPNVLIGNTGGGTLVDLSYVYVTLENSQNMSSRFQNTLLTNNPNSRNCLFIVPIDDNLQLNTNIPFFNLDGGGCVQTINFCPDETLAIGVYLPNGELFRTFLPDNVSPLPPNPFLQITATFSMRRQPCHVAQSH
jgi:hypothetical protein